MIRLSLTQAQLLDLAIVRDIPADQLKLVSEALVELRSIPMRPTELTSKVASVLSGNKDKANAVVRPALALHSVALQSGVDIKDVISEAMASIYRDSRWTASQVEAWEQVRAPFVSFVLLPAIGFAAKILNLSYEYANILRSARIITDLRPLYNTDASAIDGAVVSFTLRLIFDSVDSDHGLSLALDEHDVKEIAEQCARALTKAQTAKRLMQTISVPTIVSGEGEDV